MVATRLIPLHVNKRKTIAQSLGDRTDYAKNPEKTEKGELVTGYQSDPMTVDEEFMLSKRQYEQITGRRQKHEVIAYQYMAPAVFETGQFEYIQEHLRILSAFYGVLRPMDGVTPYRLEMQARAAVGGYKDLYALWGNRLYEAVRNESGIILNLASKEYSKCIEVCLSEEDRYITPVFCEEAGGKLVTKGTYAKIARGEMVRFMAENRIEDPSEIRSFDRLGYRFREELSSDTRYIFERVKAE